MRTWRREPFNDGLAARQPRPPDSSRTARATYGPHRATDRLADRHRPARRAGARGVRRYGHTEARPSSALTGGLAGRCRQPLPLRCRPATLSCACAIARPRRPVPEWRLGTRDGTLWISTVDGLEAYPGRTTPVPSAPPTSCTPTRPGAPRRPAHLPGRCPGRGGGWHALGRRRQVSGGSIRRGGRIETVPTPSPDPQGHGSGLVHRPRSSRTARACGSARSTASTATTFAGARTSGTRSVCPATSRPRTGSRALHRDRPGRSGQAPSGASTAPRPFAPPFRLIAHNPDDPNSLGSGIVLSLHEDAEGTLWVGTLGGGLNRVDARWPRHPLPPR